MLAGSEADAKRSDRRFVPDGAAKRQGQRRTLRAIADELAVGYVGWRSAVGAARRMMPPERIITERTADVHVIALLLPASWAKFAGIDPCRAGARGRGDRRGLARGAIS